MEQPVLVQEARQPARARLTVAAVLKPGGSAAGYASRLASQTGAGCLGKVRKTVCMQACVGVLSHDCL